MAGISDLLYFLAIPIRCSEFSGFEKCLVKYAHMAFGAPAKNFSTPSSHDSDESEELFLEDKLPTKSRDPSNPSNASTVTSNKRNAAPVPNNPQT